MTVFCSLAASRPLLRRVPEKRLTLLRMTMVSAGISKNVSVALLLSLCVSVTSLEDFKDQPTQRRALRNILTHGPNSPQSLAWFCE
jgi:hypothetical protein